MGFLVFGRSWLAVMAQLRKRDSQCAWLRVLWLLAHTRALQEEAARRKRVRDARLWAVAIIAK